MTILADNPSTELVAVLLDGYHFQCWNNSVIVLKATTKMKIILTKAQLIQLPIWQRLCSLVLTKCI